MTGRDYEREMDELFATFDVNGDGSLDYEELHRLLRVGQRPRACARSSMYRHSLHASTTFHI